MGTSKYAGYDLSIPTCEVKKVCSETYETLENLMTKFGVSIGDLVRIAQGNDETFLLSLNQLEDDQDDDAIFEEIENALIAVQDEFIEKKSFDIFPCDIGYDDITRADDQEVEFWGITFAIDEHLAEMNCSMVTWVQEG